MAEKWLIDANSICRGCPSYADCKGECWSEGECEIYDVLVKAPTVDAVEVVRCKDCQYWQDNNGGYPHEECRWGKDETPDADDFCSRGERKDNE